MKHHFRTRTSIEAPIEDVFAFFSAAGNLERITPPSLRFQILTPLPIKMEEDVLIEYKLRINGIPARWRTRIPVWNPPYEFVDEQLSGPYKSWVHTHRFREEDGRTIMDDHVEYSLPFFPFGLVAYPFVRAQVEAIFAHRAHAIRERFSGE
ncbi:SRPBCC family protein [Paenibacillus sp. IB182496]|uniref:SRPBCC family protein n=1 Tax=Paenibacillus sabuli TaxID=2772509 RepID=A0A927BXP7_9BACL|nr:SRPBCC family protein [Paenibacillus sabuli]MBD2847821.1 SRPBCC family protein [Paenibacillus sabuli]